MLGGPFSVGGGLDGLDGLDLRGPDDPPAPVERLHLHVRDVPGLRRQSHLGVQPVPLRTRYGPQPRLRPAAEHGVTARVEQPAHEDDLVQTLNEWAEQEDADLIVIGLRKRSAIGKFILGSQAQRILLEAEVPVLTVKA